MRDILEACVRISRENEIVIFAVVKLWPSYIQRKREWVARRADLYGRAPSYLLDLLVP